MGLCFEADCELPSKWHHKGGPLRVSGQCCPLGVLQDLTAADLSTLQQGHHPLFRVRLPV